MTNDESILGALQALAQTVTNKMSQMTRGEREDQLRAPFENFMASVADALRLNLVCTGETSLPDRLGRPDYAVHHNKLLSGYVELKAPGVGANVKRFKGHNRDQWKRFSSIPNILYTDGNEWALYRSGVLVDKIVCLSGDISKEGKKAATPPDAHAIERLLHDYLSWEPIIPTGRNGKIDLKDFAAMIAPLCRMLRDDVTDALKDSDSPLVQLAKDWRELLFPDASDEQFADAYAQTVAFALLLGRSEGADPLTLDSAEKALDAQHSLLSRALQVLTDTNAREEISASLNLILRVIGFIPTASLTGPDDHWLYFYEDFLAVYDPKLRKDYGAYYTPIEVVRAQVRLIDDLLVNRLNKPLGFADPSVITLDPAAGTGTYLLGVIEHALGRIESEQGGGAVAGQATALANNLYGFELMVGPYAVTELRVSRALRDRGAELPKDGTHIYLTDTLESPNAKPPQTVMGFAQKAFAEQHKKATRVKAEVPVIVCLGNPPYDRHEAVDTKDEENLSRYGGWVRFGDPLPADTIKDKKGKKRKLKSAKARLTERERHSIFRNFIDPVIAAGHGIHVKNAYNLYVYFWRWALWKVFEHETIEDGGSGMGFQPMNHGHDGHATSKPTGGPGVVSFISASSYLDGDAFCGMREHMRRVCDEIWILDLGGEGRGTRKTDNVFAIQTPVAIAVTVRGGTGFQTVNHGQDGHTTSTSNEESSVKIRQGAYLPHWTKDHSIYSVTFRLSDSLPKSVVEGWLAERENIIQISKQMNRSLSEDEEKRLQYLFSEKVDKYMDAGHGACWMKQDKIAQIIDNALRHFDGERYLLLAWCIMPNHVHVVVQPLPKHELPNILHSWKSFTASHANKALKRKGSFWQPEYYDHLIRDEQDLAHSLEYVLCNPEKAGLEDWKWVGGGMGFQPMNHGQDARATSTPAKVHYARIDGTRDTKLAELDAIGDFESVKWQDCPDDWQAPFRPACKGNYFDWPLLTDLMPWQHSGVQLKRTWPICHNPDTLEIRWRKLLTSENMVMAFKETRDRKISSKCSSLLETNETAKPVDQLPCNSSAPSVVRYAYRSFDRQ